MIGKKNIIILHGWGGSPDTWQNAAKSLKKSGFNVFVPYLPGFDPKAPLKAPYELTDYSKWFQSYLQRSEIKNPIIVAHSYGARIAGYYAALHPDKINKLILVGAAGIPAKNKLKVDAFKSLAKIGKGAFGLLEGTKLEASAKKLLYLLARESDYQKASPVMKETMKNMLALDITTYYAQIKCPTLLIWGKDDTYTPLWMGQRINKLIKDSRLVIYDAKHGIHLTHPDKLAAEIAAFI